MKNSADSPKIKDLNELKRMCKNLPMTHISVRFPTTEEKIYIMSKFKKAAKQNKTTANKLIITFIKNYK